MAQRFKVVEDPRIDEVEKVMPGANCGGCGYAGCHAFAEAAVKAPNLDKNYCPVGGNDVMKKVAAILGYEVKEKAPMLAVVRCNGTCANRPRLYEYDGAMSCKTKVGVAPDTLCRFGCLGCGDCEAVCKFDAIKVDPALGIAVVDETKCTACGACVKACPRGLIELRNKGPRGMRMFVSCRNLTKGAEAREACDVSCIGCGICFKTCQHGAIQMLNNVAYIDYTKCKLCRECEAMCPRGAIHGVNFPKPLDKAAVKARILERQKKAREAEAAAKAAEASAAKPVEKKED